MIKLVASSLLAVLLALSVTACGDSNGGSVASVATGPLRVTGGGAARMRMPGADNSLEEYGHEASRIELERAAAAVHAYLVAWVDEDWRSACSVGSSKLHRILSGASSEARRPNCAKTIAEVARSEAPLGKTPYEATDMNAVGLRKEGNFGYLFFYLGKTAYQQEVFLEHGRWGVKAPLPSSPH